MMAFALDQGHASRSHAKGLIHGRWAIGLELRREEPVRQPRLVFA